MGVDRNYDHDDGDLWLLGLLIMVNQLAVKGPFVFTCISLTPSTIFRKRGNYMYYDSYWLVTWVRTYVPSFSIPKALGICRNKKKKYLDMAILVILLV